MKNVIIILCWFTFFCSPITRSAPQLSDNDSLITSIISNINSDSIRYVIQSLQDFQTRFLLSNKRFNAADWIENRFHEIGITDVERDSFMCHTIYMVDTTTLQINIIGTITGTTRPEEVYITGGHYDCFAYGDPMNIAPGADDNASGASSALEFARALIQSGYRPEATIKFIAFAAEEFMNFGECGSDHYARQAKTDSMNIQMMINCDMISYTDKPLEQSRIHINYYSGYESLRDFAIDVTAQFSMITPLAGGLNHKSDSFPFYQQGFPAIYFEEDDFSPFYHSTGDTIGNYNMDFCREVIKSTGATILKYMLLNPTENLEAETEIIPENMNLYQNYPNPFNPLTNIRYDIVKRQFITLKVYDTLGKEVAVLINREQLPGKYSVAFNAGSLTSGVYFYQLQGESFVVVRKMILIK
jgi:hypothetical protein